ncbi:hypothetical protein LCGC14_2397160, partial [marine sediment metagenome]
MTIDRDVEERLLALQRGLGSLDTRLEYAERRVRAVRNEQFVNEFLGGLEDIGELGAVDT